jgi:hypothetical protein
VNSEECIGLDVHQATISVVVLNSTGKVVMESILETKAASILQFPAGLRGTLWGTFEEGTCAAWLYDLLKHHVAKLVVCNPRKNALLKDGNKSHRIDARKLAELLRSNPLTPVYHGETGLIHVLAEYYSGFSTLDIQAIVPYFHQPALLIAPKEWQQCPLLPPWPLSSGLPLKARRARGYGRSELNLQQVKLLSATAALASAHGLRLQRARRPLLHSARADPRLRQARLNDTVPRAWRVTA